MRIRVLGAGIIGLACVDELVTRGHDVRLVDPNPGSGASYAAAGMLSPYAEAWWCEPTLLELGLWSAELWPAYAARWGVPIRTHGTVLVGLDHGDLQQVERQVDLLQRCGLALRPLSRPELRRLEPTLSPRIAGGAMLPNDHSIDPRAVVAALLARHAHRLDSSPDADVDLTVVATGARLPAPFDHLVRRVRGEILRARTDDPPQLTVRGWVRGRPVYVVPRADGEVVVGATSEEHDEDAVATLGGVARLLGDALELLPGLDRASLTEVVARDRPGSPDNLPMVGPTRLPGHLLAAGHYRHGVLLAPATARLIADYLETGYVHPHLDPRRFDSGRNPS